PPLPRPFNAQPEHLLAMRTGASIHRRSGRFRHVQLPGEVFSIEYRLEGARTINALATARVRRAPLVIIATRVRGGGAACPPPSGNAPTRTPPSNPAPAQYAAS